MAARPIRLREVRRIDDLGRHDQQRVAAGDVEAIEILRDDGVGAVGHTVSAQVSRLDPRGHDLERATAAAAAGKEAAGDDWSRTIPARGRHALPVAPLCARRTKHERPRLRAGVALDLDRLVVRPADAHARR
jgi:hypothetical protein